MNLNQLKYFQAVCNFQTVSAASRYLHISQPSLSNAIKELEEEFNVLLFKRQHRGMVLTTAGETLKNLSDELLERADQLEQIMCDLGRERKVLRLGVPPMIGSLVMPCIYRDFLINHPEMELDITEGGSQELKQWLHNETLDMIFTPHNYPKESGISSVPVSRWEIVCAVSQKNPLSNNKVICYNELDKVPLVLFQNNFYQTEEIKKQFSDAGIKPNILLQTEQLSTMLSLISGNVAAGFMFRHVVDSHAGLVAIPLEKPLFAEVSLSWKQNAYWFNAMKIFKEFIVDKDLFLNI